MQSYIAFLRDEDSYIRHDRFIQVKKVSRVDSFPLAVAQVQLGAKKNPPHLL